MSIKAYDADPYHDDFNTAGIEGKNYLRILFKPGLSVQVRELNQLQSMLQSQIDKFGKSVYQEGPILDGSTFFDDNIDFIDVTIPTVPAGLGLLTNLNRTHGKTIRVQGVDGGLSAEIFDHELLSIASSSVRFYIRYNSSSANQRAAVDGSANETFTNLSNLEVDTAITTQDVAGSNYIGPEGDFGDITKVGYAGRITTDIGVFFARGSFIYNDSLKYTYIEKPSSTFNLSGKAVFRLDETIVTSSTDSQLLDIAGGTPNHKAPGADRYAITLVPLFLTDQSELSADDLNNSSVIASTTSGGSLINYLDLLDITVSQYVAPARVGYSQLDSKLAIRTSEESGDYTVNPFKVGVREHLNDGAGNGGRYLSSDTPVGDASKYVATIEPSVAYVQGYRVTLDESLDISVDKARTELETINSAGTLVKAPITTFGAATLGNYIEGTIGTGSSLTAGLPKFNDPSETYTFNGTGSVTCRIRAIERKSGTGATAVFKVYIYDLSADIPRDATTLTGEAADNSSESFILTLTGTTSTEPTPIFDTADNKNFISLPYTTISNISKGGISPDFESEVVIRGMKTDASLTSDAITFTVAQLLNDNNKTAGRFFNDSTNSYIVVDNADGSIIDVTAVDLTPSGHVNSNKVTLTVSHGNTTCTVIAPVKMKIGTDGLLAKTKSAKVRSEQTDAANVAGLVTFSGDQNDVEDGDKFEDVLNGTGNTTVSTNDILDLDRYDVYKIIKVVDGNGVQIPSDQYELDTGQRDGLYKVGKIKYTGSTDRTGFRVDYKFYIHGAGDFFDVTSYPNYTTTGYADIPQYKGTFLSDVLDFRQKDNATSAFTLDPNSPTKVKLNYYLSRLDKVVVNTLGDFDVISGEPSNEPDPPQVPADSMALYDIFVPAYTRKIKDIQLRFIDNRRFTMRDIGRLEKRIENLEYYTSLSLLEREANGKKILDDDGDRFKNGILVDSFQTQGIADVLDPKLKVAFDTSKGELSPQYTMVNKRLKFEGYNGVDQLIVGGRADGGGTLLSLPYTSTPLITQDTASIDISVNPFDLATWNGTVELSPASDEWIETQRRPDVIFNINGSLDAVANILNESDALTTYADSWETHSIGKKLSQSSKKLFGSRNTAGSAKSRAGFTGNRPVRETTTTFQTTEVREGIKQEATVNTVEQNIGDSVVDVSFIPFIRSRRVYF